MAELATIARPYADALFKALVEELDSAAVWVEELDLIGQNAQLQQFALNPNVTNAQVFDLIAGVSRVSLPEKAKNFLRTVIDNGRLNALPEIANQFRAPRDPPLRYDGVSPLALANVRTSLLHR